MTKFLIIRQTLLALVPTILDIVKAIEGPGNGTAKLATVVELVLGAFAALPEEVRKLIPINIVKAFIEKAVDAAAAPYNPTGIFKEQPA